MTPRAGVVVQRVSTEVGRGLLKSSTAERISSSPRWSFRRQRAFIVCEDADIDGGETRAR